MQSEEAGDDNDHDHYADDVENVHCLAPIDTLAGSAAPSFQSLTNSYLSLFRIETSAGDKTRLVSSAESRGERGELGDT